MNKKIAVIIGAGPAGLTAGVEFLDKSSIKPIILEKDEVLGGISRTIDYKGNKIDIGGHRFFSKNKIIQQFWQRFLPIGEEGMLIRKRKSRIYYNNCFFDYPINLSWNTLKKLGIVNTVELIYDYIKSSIKKRPEKSLEDFYVNRFGKKLYRLFFEDYTFKVWGIHPSQLSPDWGSQRIKALSIAEILKNALKTNTKNPQVQHASLINTFLYPKYGPGFFWEKVGKYIQEKNGVIKRGVQVKKILIDKENRVYGVKAFKHEEKSSLFFKCDYLLSSLPLKDLINSLEGIDIPSKVKTIANNLVYRDFITIGLLLDFKNKKEESIASISNFKDNWIYIQDPKIKLGRIQIFNNWSPYLVSENNKIWIGLEYFCNEGDKLWEMTDEDIVSLASEELIYLGLINKKNIIDSIVIKMQKAYPTYMGSYYEIDHLRKFLNGIKNLYCIGRNGQHRYNNMDHSMLTGIEAVDILINNISDKTSLWNINEDKEYLEIEK